MIEYLGVMTQAIQDGYREIAQFEIGMLNTTKNGLFTIKAKASPAAIENTRFSTGDFISVKARLALVKYCVKRDETITREQLDDLCEKIRAGAEKCAQAWREGNKNFTTRWIDNETQ